MIKRFLLLISLVLSLVFLFLPFSVHATVDVSADCAIVINADTYEIAFQKNAHKVRSMASTTKIMTSVLAIESSKLNDIVTVKEKINVEGTSIGAKQGYKYKLIDLIYGMLLESGNDAAVLVATHICGSEKAFAKEMNKKAKEIGMLDTNFVTASGLDDENHYTTAYDMALLGAYAIKNDTFRKICSTEIKRINLVSPDISFTFTNHNRLLKTYEGVIGIKTGFTKKSGRCLVSACERDGVRYVAVTLSAYDDWNDHKKLYDYVFSCTEKFIFTPHIPDFTSVYGGEKNTVILCCDKLSFGYINKDKYSYQILLPKIIYAPLKKEDKVGSVRITLNGKIICQQDIIAYEDVKCISGKKTVKKSLIKKIFDYLKNQNREENFYDRR